ncbi:HlyD family type I secretion periplasmic adaptor subunit [Martelella lutilitoris]|uniref:Membrane fusion protein (MFP) family protein n=1 Tax=Martelella lutilitoris TaxID=2583532 RepID=A0A5C4JW46_9HYPH|nr:HlyD family type I secretion periplasmic adaptor subunit [Martelella lutilitoris]TNB49565.1 HlyD family type I secretion periplasmic adaptor subunit [Martelella lutilitoris]
MSERLSPTKFLVTGFVALGLGLGGIAAWGATTRINGAVIAAGQVEVQARRQVIQHQYGGIVAKIDVHDGEKVKAGQQLVLLDDSELNGQRMILNRQIFEARAKLERARAQAQGADELAFSPGLVAEAQANPDYQSILEDERKVFDVQAESNALMAQQLAEQQAQANAVIAANREQIAAFEKALAIDDQEIDRYQGLLDRGLAQANSLSSMKHEAAMVEAEIADLKAEIADVNGKLAGYAVQLLRVKADARLAAQQEYAETQPQLAQMEEKLNVIEKEYDRLSLRAPMDGTVYDLKVFTIGGVIQPGAEVAAIAADDEPLTLALRVPPAEIDRVSVGQDAIVKFPNFDSRSTPELFGTVLTVSADVLTEERTGAPYFRVEATLAPASEDEAEKLGIKPGMPVTAFIQTGARSPVSYLLKPMTDYFDMAFRDD